MDKPLLRSTAKNLLALPVDPASHSNVMMAPQEMLDFLATRAGIKPVFLTGRGFDDAAWIDGAIGISKKAGMVVSEGPFWDAQEEDGNLPEWFRKHLVETRPAGNAYYITKSAAIADRVRKTFEGGITVEEEAELLGYPACCVGEHYQRNRIVNATFYKILERTAGGNSDEMKRLLREDAELVAETDEEKAAFAKATNFKPAPFTSFHMCEGCQSKLDSPAWIISKRYKKLAETISPDLAARVEQNQAHVGS
jgi:hypothetical protein